jgi:long-chain acyl-CoA synthetase
MKVGIDKRRTIFKSVLDAFGGNLDHIICGGAKLNPELITAFEDFGISIFEGFGITECSPLVSVTPYYARKLGAIGPHVPCCRVRVRVDPNGETTEEGYVMGEIQVKGDNVMIGYYNNPEANADVFTDDGWFRTGDVGYLDNDGYIYITGRIKFVIVLENGKNVFPEEIEEYLDMIELISECCVIGRKSEDGDEVIVTAVVYPDYSKFPEGADDESVKEAIRKAINAMNKKLPTFKQIKAVEIRKTEFEKTTTKKIKRQLVK